MSTDIDPIESANPADDPAERQREVSVRTLPSGLLVVLLLALGALAVWAYASGLRGPFVFDDQWNIVSNPLVRDLGLYLRPWRLSADETSRAHVEQLFTFRTRFVAYLSFALDYRWHGLDARAFRTTNVAIHLLAALTFFALVRRLLRLPRLRGSRLAGAADELALASCALFLLHPIQTQAVTYIVQRMASLAGLLCLVALWSYLGARTATRTGPRVAWMAASTLALLAAIWTKQNAATFPLVLVAAELAGFEGSVRRRVRWLLPAAVALVLAPVPTLLATAGPGTDFDLRPVTSSPTSNLLPLPIYLASQSCVVVRYLGLLLIPVGQNVDPEVSIPRSLLEPKVLVCALLLLALLLAGVRWLRAQTPADPALRLVGLGIVWFFVTLAVESSLIPIVDPMVEHRLYLPSAGLFLAGVVGATLVVSPGRRRLLYATLASLIMVLAAMTSARNSVWRSEVLLWRDALDKSPGKARVAASLGQALLRARRVDEAETYLHRALELDPDQTAARVNLGVVYRARGDADLARAELERAVEAEPDHWVARLNLGDLAWLAGDRVRAKTQWRRAAQFELFTRSAERRLRRVQEAEASGRGGVEATPPWGEEPQESRGEVNPPRDRP